MIREKEPTCPKLRHCRNFTIETSNLMFMTKRWLAYLPLWTAILWTDSTTKICNTHVESNFANLKRIMDSHKFEMEHGSRYKLRSELGTNTQKASQVFQVIGQPELIQQSTKW
jgi:virulence-associated protein VapD